MNGEQQLHDAQKTLADLRDHLARHDKPIAFFFGAGTSCAVRVASPPENTQTQPLIPVVSGLTEHVEFAPLDWVDWFNNRRLLEPIGNIPPVEFEQLYSHQQETQAMVA